MKPSRIAIAALIVACVLSTPTQAAVLEASASASIKNLTFTLIDLAPTDGISPSMVFNTSHGYGLGDEPQCCFPVGLNNHAEAHAWDASWQERVGYNQQVELWGTPHQFMSTNELDKTARGINVHTSTAQDALSLSASVSLDTGVAEHDLTRRGVISLGDPGYFNNAFVLGPNTGLIIEGDYDLSIYRSSNIGQARARVEFSVYDPGQASPMGIAENIDTFWTHQNDARSGSFTFNLANHSSASQHYGLYADMVVDASLAVPEPGGVGMGVAGLSILGLMAAARRRQQKQA